MDDPNRKRKNIDTPETMMVGEDTGQEGVLVQFEYVLDTRRTTGMSKDDINNGIHSALTQQYKNYCVQNNWYPTGNGPDFHIAKQDWKGIPIIRRMEYVNKYKIPKKYIVVYRIFGFVVPKEKATELPRDKINLNLYDGSAKNSTDLNGV